MSVCKNCVREYVWNGDNPNNPLPGECKDCQVGLDGKPTNYQRKPQTNADRIRAMSDEELEDFLFTEEWMCDTYNSCSVCPLRGEKGCISLLEWLKQPAEGE